MSIRLETSSKILEENLSGSVLNASSYWLSTSVHRSCSITVAASNSDQRWLHDETHVSDVCGSCISVPLQSCPTNIQKLLDKTHHLAQAHEGCSTVVGLPCNQVSTEYA